MHTVSSKEIRIRKNCLAGGREGMAFSRAVELFASLFGTAESRALPKLAFAQQIFLKTSPDRVILQILSPSPLLLTPPGLCSWIPDIPSPDRSRLRCRPLLANTPSSLASAWYEWRCRNRDCPRNPRRAPIRRRPRAALVRVLQ